MRLTKIEINGFKSFEKKTELLINRGITGIVGPNGSGKSNIADAIRWVLGEQSSKNLRGTKMEDVIFGGTQNRAKKAFCEVTLFFDNEDGRIASDYSEIAVGRKMFRSGESEYYLNGNSVRLKDILDLIRDTGIGKEGYSIVGQGRIDEILSSKPLARRKVFEEAAGVMKFRTRKEEAEHKLERTRDNLTRVADILGELSSQVEPLREQAEKTRQYLSLFGRQKILDMNIYAQNYERMGKRMEKLQAELAELEAAIEAEQSGFGSSAMETEELTRRLEQLEGELAGLREEISKKATENERAAGEEKLLEERAAALSRESERLGEERQAEIEQAQGLLEQIEQLKGQQEGVLEQMRQVDAQLADALSQKAEQEDRQGRKHRRREELRQRHFRLLAETAEKQSELSALEMKEESFLARAEEARSQQAEQRAQEGALRSKIAAQQQEAQRLQGQQAALTQRMNENKYRAAQQRQREEALAEALNKARAEENDVRSRKKALEGLKAEYEGYSQGVRNLMRAVRTHQQMKGKLLGTLAELIEVPEQYEAAIEAVLGGALQNIVVPGEQEAKEAIALLRRERLGRVTFLPLSALRVNGLSQREKQALGPEVIVMADQAVRSREGVSRAVEFLLARTAIVRDMEDAVALARRAGYSFRIVTLLGDIVNPGGVMTGGSIQKKQFGLLSRERDIEKLEELLKQKAGQAGQAERALAQSKKESEKLQQQAEAILLELKAGEIQAAQQRSQTEADAQQLSLLQNQMAEMEARLSGASRQSEENRQKIAELSAYLEELSQKTLAAREEGEQLDQEQDTASENLDEQISVLRISRAELAKDSQALSENMARMEMEISALEARAETKRKSAEKHASAQSALERELSQRREQGKNAQEKVRQLRQQEQEKEKKRVTMRDELARRQKHNSEFQLRQTELIERKFKVEGQAERSRLALETAGNRIWEEYGLTYADAEALRTEISFQEANRQVQEIRAEIRELGTINPNAIEEYGRVFERFTDLSMQKEDLEKAEADLQKVIAEIVSGMRSTFREKFELISRNFQEIFQVLFGGGRAKLALEEGDIMECGIEISAEPPGKKLQHISLLSGGERALTAIALLFAMLKINPSPVCLLDEIDAPLDEANVARFCEYIKTLQKESQFLIITHRKPTMAMCSSLYGVTMEEQGISKIVSVKID